MTAPTHTEADRKLAVLNAHAVSLAHQLAVWADDMYLPGPVRDALESFDAAQTAYMAAAAAVSAKAGV